MSNNSFDVARVEQLRAQCGSDSQLTVKDVSFAQSLVNQYLTKGFLSEKQWYWVDKLIERSGSTESSGGRKEKDNGVEEVFSGQLIQALLRTASEKLKFPKLRYQTDGRSKVVFSFCKDGASKWNNCTFIDNGGKEGKKRYGFINSLGNGRINSDAPPDIKALIRKVATDPTQAAKLSGQKYSFCCFCGLELVNKSSVHHGYGPICADNWGLPWGGTGGKEDEEAAAAELKHVQLHDLE